jgi:hypothetical protein
MFSGAHAHGPVWLPGARPRTHNKNQTRWIFIICCLVIDGEVVLKASWWPDPGGSFCTVLPAPGKIFQLVERKKEERRQNDSETKIWEKEQKGEKLLLYSYFIFYAVFVDWAVWVAINLKFDKYRILVTTAVCFMRHNWLSMIKLTAQCNICWAWHELCRVIY